MEEHEAKSKPESASRRSGCSSRLRRSSRRRARFRPAKSLQNWSDGSPSSEVVDVPRISTRKKIRKVFDTDRIEVLPEQALDGRRLLDLGNERREAVAAARGIQRPDEVPGGRRALGGLHHLLERRLGLPLGHLDLLVPDDLLQDVARDVPVGADALGGVPGAAAAADADALRGGDGVDGLAALPLDHLRRVEHLVVQPVQDRALSSSHPPN
jgi:hypothetical protein